MRKYLLLYIIYFGMTVGAYAANQRFTLVIDAGHGGHDSGAVGSFAKEKNINLNVALAFGRMVEQNCPDVRVIYTRKTDVFVPLQERANIANKAGADLFISVHTNSLPAGRVARGFETYTLGMHRAKDNLDVAMRENSVISMEKDYKQRYQGFDPKSSESYIMFEFMQSANMEKSVELAKMIQQSVCSTVGRVNKGVHQAGFLVLRATSMPSCLIELGFITARDEEEFLSSDEGANAMGAAICRAFIQYKNKYSDKIVVPYQAPRNKGFESVGHVVPQPIISASGIQMETDQKVLKKKKKNEEKERNKQQEAGRLKQEKQQEANSQSQAPVNTVTTLNPAIQETGLVFKIQIFALNRMLRPGSEQFKGYKAVDCYKEGGAVKYTIGSSADYDEIVKLRQKLQKDFPQCFIIAFKNGARTDINKAIEEFKASKR